MASLWDLEEALDFGWSTCNCYCTDNETFLIESLDFAVDAILHLRITQSTKKTTKKTANTMSTN